jgi:flagellar motor switch protein FliN/FliY
MKYDELIERYQPAMNELLSALSEAGGEALQDKIEIHPGEPEPLTAEFTPEYEYPILKVSLESSAEGKYNHSLLMDKSMAGLIFSWTGGGDVPEEISEEHLNAVKEAVVQVVGQLQAAQEGKEHAFTSGEIELVEVTSQEELVLPEEGLLTVYRFTRGEEETEYLVTHVVQGEIASDEAGEAPAEEVEEGSEAEVAPGEEGLEAGETPAEEGESVETAVEGAEAEEAGEEAGEEAMAEDAAEGEAEEPAEDVPEDQPVDLAPAGEEDLGDAEDIAALFGAAGDEGGVVEVSPAEFDEFVEAAPGDGKGRKINLLLDVELDVSVELGRKIMIVDEILRLGKGSVIELNKLAGEPVDVLVNGKKLAEGEVVVVEDHFGVRLTHLLDPKERIKSLGR